MQKYTIKTLKNEKTSPILEPRPLVLISTISYRSDAAIGKTSKTAVLLKFYW